MDNIICIICTEEVPVSQGEDLTAFPAEFDPERPNAARVYDYYLGGASNLKVDREFGREVHAELPEARDYALLTRAFLRRTVRFCAQQGIRQFLDVGSGIPTVGHTHEIAHSVDPSCRVVYVDNEPFAVAHSDLLLAENEQAAVVQADLRNPHAVLHAPATRRLLDFDEPIALLMVALLHFVEDEHELHRLLKQYRDALTPGSYLVISHGTGDGIDERVQRVAAMYQRTNRPGYLRSRTEIEGLFEGFELIEPGVVYTSQWRPDSPQESTDPQRALAYGGVGFKVC